MNEENKALIDAVKGLTGPQRAVVHTMILKAVSNQEEYIATLLAIRDETTDARIPPMINVVLAEVNPVLAARVEKEIAQQCKGQRVNH